MALGFQKTLNRFQFERTVDWRVRFPDLSVIDPSLATDFPDGYFFAKSVAIPTSLIEIEDDKQLVGFYQSRLVQPTLKIELYTDGNGRIETALRVWNRAAFTNEGYMPSPTGNTSDSYPGQALQRVIVARINPVNLEEVKKSFNSNGDSFDYDILEGYLFRGYLAKLPEYIGQQGSASIRTVSLTIKVLTMGILLSDKARDIETALAKKNPTEGFYSDIHDKNRALNLYLEYPPN